MPLQSEKSFFYTEFVEKEWACMHEFFVYWLSFNYVLKALTKTTHNMQSQCEFYYCIIGFSSFIEKIFLTTIFFIWIQI